jgi:CspA family cold shock protein
MSNRGKQVSAGDTGYVQHYNDEKGYGFVSTNFSKVDDDLFFHISEVDQENVSEGDELYYKIHDNRRGYQACQVTVIHEGSEREVDGEVSFYNPDDGFGFITNISGVYEKVFVHISDVDADELHTGDQVDFNVVDGDEGVEAKHVRVTSASPPPDRDDPKHDHKKKKDIAKGQSSSVPDEQPSNSRSTGSAFDSGEGDPDNLNKLLGGDQ